MDLTERLIDAAGTQDPAVAWAASGAMSLTGRSDGPPLAAPDLLADTMTRLAGRLHSLTAALGRAVVLDGPALLGERAALAGLTRQGTRSPGGGTGLLRAGDGWVAVSLARPDDRSLVPAWLDIDEPDPDDPWPAVADAVSERRAAEVVARAAVLGLAVTALGEAVPHGLATATPLGPDRVGPGGGARLGEVLVVDLSSLWAGPLCTQLLAQAGARVVKVESVRRPDGARQGPAPFFHLLNGQKATVAVDLGTAAGRSALAALLRRADVVVEASRPRALAQLGLAVDDVTPSGRARVWCSITGHGRTGDGANRVAFGDDAAVAGGLVAWEGADPRFCADAVADPATGLVAAVAVLERLASPGRWHLDVALARTAAHLASGPVTPPAPDTPVAAPRARPIADEARPLGTDTECVLRTFADR